MDFKLELRVAERYLCLTCALSCRDTVFRQANLTNALRLQLKGELHERLLS